MLVCPQCQFTNPDANKFCQRCGTSLTHQPCPDCGTQVLYSAKECHNCGAFTGTVWWAIISTAAGATSQSVNLPHLVPDSSQQNKEGASHQAPEKEKLRFAEDAIELDRDTMVSPCSESSPTNQQPTLSKDTSKEVAPILKGVESTNPVVSPSSSQDLDFIEFPTDDTSYLEAFESVTYLDSQQRYQLLEPMKTVDEASSTKVVRVLDSHPLEASPLEVLMTHQQNTDSPNQNEDSDSQQINPIPAIAQIYVDLKEQFDSAIPTIHDAWISNGTEVVLLEDRSNGPLLLDLWRDDEIPQMQMLHMFYDMASLWAVLEPWNYRQSLVELTNLRVDEDQTLVLQRLYSDPPEASLNLQVLGHVWNELFRQTGRTLIGWTGELISDLQTAKIQTIDELRFRLEKIANELQGDLNPSIAMAPFDPDTNSDSDIESSSVAAASTKLQSLVHPGNVAESEDAPTVVLPMQLLSLEDAGRTDVGRQRRHNEDYFGVHTTLTKIENPFGRTVQARGLYILCDGMGGHAGGEVASALAVKTLNQYFQTQWQEELPDEECIRKAVLQANQVLYDVNQQDARSGSGRMGTTLVMVLIQDTQVVVAHVGDSRLYRVSRRQGLEQLTVDHEVGQREMGRGVPIEIAYSRPDAYQLTQALGPRNEQFVVPDVQFFELNEDTLLLLCSDGLSDNDLIEKNWQTHLKPLLSSQANLEQGANKLIELANQYNGHDNITAVLIRAKVRPDLEQARVGNA